jgi:diphosphomevalonate decarboxylase
VALPTPRTAPAFKLSAAIPITIIGGFAEPSQPKENQLFCWPAPRQLLAASGMEDPTFSVTVSSPTNIALIKYWGKRDSKLNLPINSSVSVTLNQRDLRTVTTVTASPAYEKDRLWLNGVEEDVSASKRLQAVFREVRKRAGELRDPKTGEVHTRKGGWDGYHVWVVSENNFPTAAGLASSAAGYSALTFALAKLYGVPESLAGELSCVARMGSGSACRSLAGGFVAWDMGSKADGTDSRARQVAAETHWPELQVLVLVISDTKKTVSSTAGMQTSVETSALLAHRASAVVPARMEQMEAAYRARDFPAVAELMMRDSNQFHATCLDTYPPVCYMNDASRSVVRMVHALNDSCGAVVCGYTFDAGPNAVLLTLKQHTPVVLAAVTAYFPPRRRIGSTLGSKPDLVSAVTSATLPPSLVANYPLPPQRDVVSYVYHTDVGPGAMVLDDVESLATPDGTPKRAVAAPWYTRPVGAQGAVILALKACCIIFPVAMAYRRLR